MCFISPKQRFEDSAGTNKEVSHWERELSLCWAAVCPSPPCGGEGGDLHRHGAFTSWTYSEETCSLHPVELKPQSFLHASGIKAGRFQGCVWYHQPGQLLKAQLVPKAPVKICPQQAPHMATTAPSSPTWSRLSSSSSVPSASAP